MHFPSELAKHIGQNAKIDRNGNIHIECEVNQNIEENLKKTKAVAASLRKELSKQTKDKITMTFRDSCDNPFGIFFVDSKAENLSKMVEQTLTKMQVPFYGIKWVRKTCYTDMLMVKIEMKYFKRNKPTIILNSDGTWLLESKEI